MSHPLVDRLSKAAIELAQEARPENMDARLAAHCAAKFGLETTLASNAERIANLEADAHPEAARISDAVIGWLVKCGLADADNEYYAADVIEILNDLAPARAALSVEASE